MRMHHRIAILSAGDAAVEGGDFHLLVEPDHLEGLLWPVRPADHRRAKGADRREMGVGEVVLLGELGQAGGHVIAFGKNKTENSHLGAEFGGFHARRHAVMQLRAGGVVGRKRRVLRIGACRGGSHQDESEKTGSHRTLRHCSSCRPMAFSVFDMDAPSPSASGLCAPFPGAIQADAAMAGNMTPQPCTETHVALRYCASFSKRLNGWLYRGMAGECRVRFCCFLPLPSPGSALPL